MNLPQKYEVVTSSTHSLASVRGILGRMALEKRVALDTESYPLRQVWGRQASGLDPHTSRVRLVSLCGAEYGPILFDLKELDAEGTQVLRDYLSNSEQEMVAHAMTYDLKVIQSTLGVMLRKPRCSLLALASISLATGFKKAEERGFNLKAMVRDLLGVHLSKDEQVSDWEGDLTQEQLDYAALDVGAPNNKPYRSCVLECYQMLHKQAEGLGIMEAWDLDQAMLPLTARMELEGMSVSQKVLGIMRPVLEQQLEPIQIALCEALGLAIHKRLRKTPEGLVEVTVPSPESLKALNYKAGLVHRVNKHLKLDLENLAEESLEPHADIELIKILIQFTTLSKLLGEVGKYQRLPNPKTGNIHPGFSIIGTSTGRFAGKSSGNSVEEDIDDEALSKTDRLNIQQASGINLVVIVKGDPWGFATGPDKETEYKHSIKLRNCIISGPKEINYDFDYGNQEMLVAAVLAQEEAILECLYNTENNDLLRDSDGNPILHPETGKTILNPLNDLHLVVTLAVFPELNEVPLYDLAYVASHTTPPGKGLNWRHYGKILNLSVLYEKQANSLAASMKVTVEEATEFMKAYAKRFPKLTKWKKRQAQAAKDLRWLTLPGGRRLWVSEANAKGQADKGAVGRKGINSLVQGVSALMMKRAMLYIHERIEPNEARILATIHDGLLVSIPGKWEYKGMKVDAFGFATPEFVVDERSQAIGERIRQCMIDAEGDTLDPILGRRAPRLVGKPAIAPYWKH